MEKTIFETIYYDPQLLEQAWLQCFECKRFLLFIFLLIVQRRALLFTQAYCVCLVCRWTRELADASQYYVEFYIRSLHLSLIKASFCQFIPVHFSNCLFFCPPWPAARIGRSKLSPSDVDGMLKYTPKLSRGSDRLFRKLHDKGECPFFTLPSLPLPTPPPLAAHLVRGPYALCPVLSYCPRSRVEFMENYKGATQSGCVMAKCE